MMHNRVGSMVLAGAVTAGPRLPQPHGPPAPAAPGSPRTERAQGRPQLEALAPPGSPGDTAGPGLPRVPVAARPLPGAEVGAGHR